MAYKLDPRNPPHMIHGDSIGGVKRAYPTHTHGLASVGMPELFINANSFGPEDNARIINAIVVMIATSDELLKKIQAKEELELTPPPIDDFCFMIRSVPNHHLGVIAAYSERDRDGVEFAQLYVKGDDHVIEEEYFAEAYVLATNPNLEDGGCQACLPGDSLLIDEDGDIRKKK